MASFNLDQAILKKLFDTNQFIIPGESKLVFAGIRGCLPDDMDNNSFGTTQSLNNNNEVNYKNLRCTLIQWKVDTGDIAVFPGSTVPSINNILGFKKNPPRKSNCLTPGFYKNYVKGKHRPANTRNWHDAFRQSGQPLAIRRTFDNTVYDNFDAIEISTGCDDNIHAAWTLDDDGENFSSAGCQVVKGIPFCESTKSMQNDNRGPWKEFKANGYAADQSFFPYALFNAAEVMRVATGAGRQVSIRLKFGSSGPLVTQLQTALINMNYLSGAADGDFGKSTFNAIKKFQLENFGIEATDCVAGPVTSQALGINLGSINI